MWTLSRNMRKFNAKVCQKFEPMRSSFPNYNMASKNRYSKSNSYHPNQPEAFPYAVLRLIQFFRKPLPLFLTKLFTCVLVFSSISFLLLQQYQVGEHSFLQPYRNCDIFFLELTPRSVLSPKSACSIESAALKHPNHTVCLLMSHLDLSKVKKQLKNFPNENVVVMSLSLDQIFDWSPLHSFWEEEFRFTSSPFRILHLNDAAKVALLYKYGGLYLDQDMLLLKPTLELDPNFVGIQYLSTDDGVNPAILKFQKFHPFLSKWIYNIPSKYEENDRNSIGAFLLTKLLIPYCQMDVPDSKKSLEELSGKHCDFDLHVYPPEVFFPLAKKNWEDAFVSGKNLDQSLKDTLSHAQGIHLWNDSDKKKMRPGEGSLYLDLARQHCPMVYWREFATVQEDLKLKLNKKRKFSPEEIDVLLQWKKLDDSMKNLAFEKIDQ